MDAVEYEWLLSDGRVAGYVSDKKEWRIKLCTVDLATHNILCQRLEIVQE